MYFFFFKYFLHCVIALCLLAFLIVYFVYDSYNNNNNNKQQETEYIDDVFVMCAQEQRIRLFDRGELNSYKDDLHFLLTVAQCCRNARLADTLTVKELERHNSMFLSLLSDVSQLLSAVNSRSVDAVFRPATQTLVREDLIALTRQYVATRWLRRVLISNNFAVDDMQHIVSAMLDASLRWGWLRDFVNVL